MGGFPSQERSSLLPSPPMQPEPTVQPEPGDVRPRRGREPAAPRRLPGWRLEQTLARWFAGSAILSLGPSCWDTQVTRATAAVQTPNRLLGQNERGPSGLLAGDAHARSHHSDI